MIHFFNETNIFQDKTMKPKILVTREVFDDVLKYLSQYFEVASNQSDIPFDYETLASRLSDKRGAMVTLTDRGASFRDHCGRRAGCF
jgi:lactate dehydrogenase-like 2-hydroxyacid dehydrogenase